MTCQNILIKYKNGYKQLLKLSKNLNYLNMVEFNDIVSRLMPFTIEERIMFNTFNYMYEINKEEFLKYITITKQQHLILFADIEELPNQLRSQLPKNSSLNLIWNNDEKLFKIL